MGDSRESRLDRKWRNDQQGEKSGQVRVRGRQRRDNKKPDGEKQGERKKSGNERRVSSSGKPSNNRASSKNRGNNNNPRANAIRRRRNENYFLTKTPPFWPFHFSVSGKMKDKSAMEQKGVKEEVVLRLCSDLNIPLVLPESLTMVIETNARLFELYGASHPWRYKHTLTSSPLSVSSPCYPDTQIDVVGVSVVEWVPIPLRPNTEELEGLIEMASFDRKNISVAFVNVGEYSLPDQRRLSACCMVNWEKEGFLIELQVCCQVYFSVREEEEDGEKRTEFHLSRKGQAYISGYRGFSTEVPDRPYNQIWEALLPSLKERGDQMLNLRKKVGVHILGDFGEFEKSKKPTILRQWTPDREEKVSYNEEIQEMLGNSPDTLPPFEEEEEEAFFELVVKEHEQDAHQSPEEEKEEEEEDPKEEESEEEVAQEKSTEEEGEDSSSSVWGLLGALWGGGGDAEEVDPSVDQSGLFLATFYKSVEYLEGL